MFLDLKHQLVDYAIHVFHHGFTTDVLLHFFSILFIKGPVRVNFSDIFEFMVQMVIIKLQRADGFDLFLASLLNAKGDDFLGMIGAAVLLSASTHLS